MPDPTSSPDDTPTVDSDPHATVASDTGDLGATVDSDAAATVDSGAGRASGGVAPSGTVTGQVPGLPEAPTIPGYEIVGQLGEGGMGVVWKAVQLATQRQVALKVMSQAMFGSSQAKVRFEREVELAARLEHPGIARVYDSGLTQGAYYYAMELVEGMTLDLWVSANQPDKRQLLTLMRDICLAAQHAHQRGVIHRDLKPGNIIVAPGEADTRESASRTSVGDRPRPVLVDFGLARPALSEGSDLTVTGQVAGTPAYMSPEQAAGKIDELDTRSDVYALGVILYKLLTGELPHDVTGGLHQVVKRIADTDIRPPRSVSARAARTVDPELTTLLLKALEKEPDRRYESAGALAADLDNYLAGEPLDARPPSLTYLLRKRAYKHRKPFAAAACSALVLLLGVGGYAWKQYHQMVVLPVDSHPQGAEIWVDGELHAGCGLTPCSVPLGPGEHTIEVRHTKFDFDPAQRVVHVAWGKARGDVSEPINLLPAYRTVVFDADEPGLRLTLSDAETGAVIETFAVPATRILDRGRYRYAVEGDEEHPEGRLLEIQGSVAPVTVRVDE